METILRLYFTDTPVKETSTITLYQMDALSKAADIKTGGAIDIPYATFEPDYWLLDGTFNFAPVNTGDAHIGVMSANTTNGMGQYDDSTDAGYINIAFAEARDVSKITLQGFRATDDYASKVLVEYFNGSTKISEYTATPGNVNYTFNNSVENVDKVRFTLLETNKPYRRARLSNVYFDDIAEFRGNMVQSAKVMKESSLLSTELPYGTLTATLIADDSTTFDATSSLSLYGQLEDRLAIDVLFDNDRTMRFIGRYYLTDWKSPNAYQLQIEAMDLIGLLEDIPYNGDHWIYDDSFNTIINRVLSFVPELKSVTIQSGFTPPALRGFLKSGNIREALQQVLFAGGASFEIINGTEFRAIPQKAQNVSGELDAEFTKATKALDGQSLAIKPAVTRLELYSHDYTQQATDSVVASFSSLPLGIHMVFFEYPVMNVTVTGAALVESTPSYAKINVTGTTAITIKGKAFVDSKVLKAVDIASASNKPNVIKIEDTTMVPSSLADAVAYRMQTFFLQKFQQEWRAFNPDILDVNRLVSVPTINNKKFIGTVERAEIDLTSGGIVDYTATGIVLDTGYTGTKSITIGSFGTVNPPYFYFPSTTPQTFVVTLKEAYKNDYGIEVMINGVKTLYVQNSVTFELPYTDQFTDVAISFPLASKPITIGGGITVTPSRFKFPVTGQQYFAVKNINSNYHVYYIKEVINGVSTLYDIGERTMMLENTTAETTVAVSAVGKPIKYVDIVHGNMADGYYASTTIKYRYPVIGNQTLSIASPYRPAPPGHNPLDPWNGSSTVTFKWFVNNNLIATHTNAEYSEFTLTSTDESTSVRLEISNLVWAASGGSGSGGGSGTSYIVWTSNVTGDYIMRDSLYAGGNFVASLGPASQVQVTAQGNGVEYAGSTLLYYGTIAWSSAYPQNVGLSGWFHSSANNPSTPNPN